MSSGKSDSKPQTKATPIIQSIPEIKTDNPIDDPPVQASIESNNHCTQTNVGSVEPPNDVPLAFISSNKIFTNTDNRPHALITANDCEHTMLLDTGSQITVVGTNWIDKLHKNWQSHLQPSQFNITTVDEKAKHSPLGVVDIPYSFMGLTRTIPTYVLSVDTRHPILGTTFLEAFNLDFARRTANGWISIPTFSAGAIPSTKINVTNLDTRTINPLHRMTASQFIGWMYYDESKDRKETCTVETTDPKESEPSLEYEIKTRQEDQEDDVVPSKTACVNTPHNLSPEQNEMIRTVLSLFHHVTTTGKLNKTSKIEHVIDTGDATPVMKKQYPFSPYIVEKVQKELDKMIERDIIMTIEYSPWRAPILAVDKKDGGCRVCLDARELNKLTVPNAYPITDVNHILSRIRKARYLSSIDLSQAFFQIPLAKSSQPKTAFAFGNRLYCFKRMTMGLKGSPSTLAILIDTIFRDLNPYAFAYVDDFIICTETFEQHVKILTIIAKRLADAGLTISPSKSHFCCKRLEFLGYVLSEDGLSANPDKVSAIKEFPRPTTAKEARRFIGAAGWYRKFISNFAEVAAPISELYKGNRKGKIDWNEEAETAFIALKEKLTTTPVLSMPDYKRPFTIYCDASLVAGAAVLTQNFEEGEKVIQYFSKKFSRPQQNYSASERECLAVLLSVEKFRPYVEGVAFTVVTDHAALKWLMTLRDPKGRLARWALRLQAYDMTIIHKAGKHMEMPDALSRAVDLIEIDPRETRDDWYIKMTKMTQSQELDRYKFENGKLYHRLKFTSYSGEKLWVLCVPSEQRLDVIREQHDQYSHQGVWKTYQRTKRYYYWPNMHESVYQYIRKCPTCRSIKPSNENTRTPHGAYREPQLPGRQLAIDLVGKLPLSKLQNQYLFVVLDCFSRFAFVKPLRFATSKAIVQYLKDVVFTRNGCPEIIISDNGKQFVSHTFEEMCKAYNIRHWKTPVYHPQANQVESTNKNIKMALRTYLIDEKSHSNWENFIEKVVQDLNTTPHTSTDHTPFYLSFGREHIRDGREYSQLIDVNPHHSLDPERLKDVQIESREKQADTYEQTKLRRSPRSKVRFFKEGDMVFIPKYKLSSAGEKYAAKLAPGKVQGYIKKCLGENTYEIIDGNQKPLGNHHASKIYTR